MVGSCQEEIRQKKGKEEEDEEKEEQERQMRSEVTKEIVASMRRQKLACSQVENSVEEGDVMDWYEDDE